MTREEAEMKPCPFCGHAEPCLSSNGSVFCPACFVKAESVSRWNRRAALAPPTASEAKTCDHGHLRRSCELCERDAEIDRLRSELSALREGVREEAGPALLYLRQVRHITTGGDLWRFVCDGDCLADVTDRLAALVEGK